MVKENRKNEGSFSDNSRKIRIVDKRGGRKAFVFRSLWQACRLRRHATSDARCRRRCDSFYKPTLCSFSCRTTFEKRVSTFLFSYPLFPLISFPFFIFYFSRKALLPAKHPRILHHETTSALFASYRRSTR